MTRPHPQSLRLRREAAIRRAAVLPLADGRFTIREIAERTGIHYQSVKTILAAARREGITVKTKPS